MIRAHWIGLLLLALSAAQGCSQSRHASPQQLVTLYFPCASDLQSGPQLLRVDVSLRDGHFRAVDQVLQLKGMGRAEGACTAEDGRVFILCTASDRRVARIDQIADGVVGAGVDLITDGRLGFSVRPIAACGGEVAVLGMGQLLVPSPAGRFESCRPFPRDLGSSLASAGSTIVVVPNDLPGDLTDRDGGAAFGRGRNRARLIGIDGDWLLVGVPSTLGYSVFMATVQDGGWIIKHANPPFPKRTTSSQLIRIGDEVLECDLGLKSDRSMRLRRGLSTVYESPSGVHPLAAAAVTATSSSPSRR